MKKFKVYVNDKLRLVCGNEITLMNNINTLTQKYRKDKIKIEQCEIDFKIDEQKLSELKSLINKF